MKKTILCLAAGIMLSSCAAHGGYFSDSASLSQANFNYVEHDLRGVAQATYILGFGGMNKNAIVDEAKRDMLSKFTLGPNQTLANVTVNFKTTNILLFSQQTCTVTADVVEFRK